MLSLTALLPLIPLLSTLVQSVEVFDYRSAIQGKSNRGDIPGRYVLEFDTSNAAKQAAKRDGGLHDHVYAQLKARGVDYDVTQTYDSDLFVGASVGLSNTEDYDTLVQLTGISAIYPVSYVPAPLEFFSTWGESQKTGYHPEWNFENIQKVQKRAESKRADEKKNKSKPTSTTTATVPAATSSSAVRSNNTAVPQGMNPNGYSFLPVSGVDKVHAEGNTGKGVKIAVIDSGVFYTNPALGGCLGAGCVIAGGKDYVGDEFDGTNEVMPDDDPLDCTGHGTFVTGIISAQLPNAYNVSGVAPGASIYAYRVFSCYSATTNDIVAKAMEDAYTDGNDVINLSLGEISSWSGSMLSVIGSRIAARGVSVLASAGNAGFAGSFYTDSPGSGVEVLSVGVADAVNFPGQNATLSYRNEPLSYIGLDNLGPGTFPLVSLSNGTTNGAELCGGIPDLSAYDVNNVVFVVQASTMAGCDMYTQGYNLLDGGATRALVITAAGTQAFLPPRFGFQLGVISPVDGQQILQQIAAGETITATFAFAPNAVLDTVNGGLVSLGSAIGPTNDMYMSTQLVAPGNNIVSTAPTASGFGASGGTSYSCAYVAGVAALYLSANGGRAASGLTAREITRALQIVSDPFPVSKNDSRLNTVAIGGAGLVQAYEAIHTPIKVSKSELLLNDTAHFADYQTFEVVNTGKDRQKFTISHLPALTAYSFKQGSYESELAPIPLVDNAAQVKFVPPVLNLKAGESKTVVVKFELPQGLDERRLPIYSGFVQVSAGSYNVQVPYLGVAASMKSFPVLDNSTAFTGDALPNLVNRNMTVQTGSASYTFENGDEPTLMYRYWVGSRLLTVDLIQSNQSSPFTPSISSPTYTIAPTTPTTWAPTPSNGNGKGQGKGLLAWLLNQLKQNNWGGQAGNGVGYEDATIVGNVYERVWIPRNSDGQDGEGIESFVFNGTLSDRTVVPAGDYRLLVRSLRVAGDMSLEGDYDYWVSPIVNVVRA